MKYIHILLIALFFIACNNSSSNKNEKKKEENKHHLNIPANGIESMMEANTSKIIEGTDGSIIITIGEVARKKVDVTIKRNDRILDERLIKENENMTFEYEGNTYNIALKNIKKPLIGAGKAEIAITQK